MIITIDAMRVVNIATYMAVPMATSGFIPRQMKTGQNNAPVPAPLKAAAMAPTNERTATANTSSNVAYKSPGEKE